MLALLLLAAPTVSVQEPAWAPVPSDDRVSGTVHFPDGTPDDERCRVLVEATEPEGLREWSFGERWARMTGSGAWFVVDEVTLDATRAFHLRLPEDAVEVRLRIEADHLYTDGHAVLTGWRDGVDAVELRPELGVRVVVQLELPADASTARSALVGRELSAAELPANPFEPGPGAHYTAVVDEGLRATFGGVRPDTLLDARLAAPPALAGSRELQVGPNREQTLAWRLSEATVLRGRVVGADGAPVVGAAVVATYAGNAQQTWARADAAGRFELALAGADAEVAVSAGGFRTRALARGAWEGQRAPGPIDVFLQPCDPVRGRVRLADGRPVVGMTLELGDGFPGSPGTPQLEARSDAAGRFEFHGVADRELLLFGRARLDAASLAGTGPVQAVDFETGAGEPFCLPPRSVHWSRAARDHIVERSPVLRGRVVDEAGVPYRTGRVMGIHHAPRDRVEAYRSYSNIAASLVLEDGFFECAAFYPGTWRFFLSAGGAKQEELRVEIGAHVEVHEWVLPRPAILAGIVLDAAGQPLAETSVRWLHPSGRDGSGETKTDADGRFRLTDVRPGPVKLKVMGDEHRSRAFWEGELARGQEIAGLELRAERCGALHVRVVDSHGGPVRNAAIHTSTDGYGPRSTSTDIQGRALLTGLAPGDLEVELRQPSSEGRGMITRGSKIARQAAVIEPGVTTELRFVWPKF